MAQGDAVAGDVPGRYDVVINGKGYQLLDSIEPSLPFRSHRATYSTTPTFVTRSNTSGAYGDNQQAFWLTVGQNDWSLGMGQRYMRTTDATSVRRMWNSSAVDVETVVGQATLLRAITSVLNTPTIIASSGNIPSLSDPYLFADSQSLYSVAAAGTVTNQGAHSAGSVKQWGVVTDGKYAWVSGATAIRRWDGSTFTSFSSTAAAGSLAYINNALYSCDGATLRTYDGTGTATTVFTWKDATGTAFSTQAAKIIPYGGKLLIFFPQLAGYPQLWQYDGAGTYVVAELPSSAIGYDMVELYGTVFISGMVQGSPNNYGAFGSWPTIWYFTGGTVGVLWQSTQSVSIAPSANSAYHPALGTYGGRLIFTDPGNRTIVEYNPGSGATVNVGSYTLGATPRFVSIASAPEGVMVNHDDGTVKSYIYPDQTSLASSGTISSSLIDFENSLTKSFHGIKVFWEGSGTVDIGYDVDGVDTYTSLKTGAVSGTEYALPAGTTGTAISYQITLNASGGNTPTLKRVYVRAAPVLDTFYQREYVLDLSGIGFKDPVQLNDGGFHPLSGHEQAVNLMSAVTATAPFSITDRFGTFTGLCDPPNCEVYEIREGNDSVEFSGGFAAKITVRQV